MKAKAYIENKYKKLNDEERERKLGKDFVFFALIWPKY
jgi:hypothetical protein